MPELRLHMLVYHPEHNTDDLIMIIKNDNLKLEWGYYVGDERRKLYDSLDYDIQRIKRDNVVTDKM